MYKDIILYLILLITAIPFAIGWIIRGFVIPFLVAKRFGRPYKLGFYTNDEELNFSNKEKKLDILSKRLAVFSCLFFLLAWIVLFLLKYMGVL